MIFGNIFNEFFERQASILPKPLRDALYFLKSADLTGHETGHFPMELGGVPMILQVCDFTTAPREKIFPEIHRKYIDLQLFVSGGTEKTTWYTDNGNGVVHENLLDTQKDTLLYENDVTVLENSVYMTPGSYAIYLPWDVHLPGQNAGSESLAFRKIVMKVPVDACVS